MVAVITQYLKYCVFLLRYACGNFALGLACVVVDELKERRKLQEEYSGLLQRSESEVWFS